MAIPASRRLLPMAILVIAARGLFACGSASAAAPILLHTPNFESPVRGGPDDLLFLAGSGFHLDDRVVYEVAGEGDSHSPHPAAVPVQSSHDSGTADVVNVGDPPYSLTVRLPDVLSADSVYRLWVVNGASQWSEPITINDARPLWVTPAHLYATADFAELGRRIRIVGRNLGPMGATRTPRVRLQGPQTYLLKAAEVAEPPSAALAFIAEASLPPRMTPGAYTVSVSRDGAHWTAVSGQKLTVLPDPGPLQRFNISDSRFGSCHPNDDADDSGCLTAAIEAAHRAGGGVVEIPAGEWDLFPTSSPADAEFILADGVSLEGAGPDATTLARRVPGQGTAPTAGPPAAHAPVPLPALAQAPPAAPSPIPGPTAAPPHGPAPLLLVEGNNSITRLKFTDERHFTSFDDSRPVIQLGHLWTDPRVASGALPDKLRNVIISNNLFRRVGIAVIDAGLPIEQLFVTRNDFGGYARGLELPGRNNSTTQLFRIEDSVIRWNRFVPGSYRDVAIRQGVIATGLGASRRVDFSSNNADGASIEGLQDPADPRGWRAAFFWNMHDSGEMLLLADNRISCSGDKAGDGEAIAFDGSGFTFGYSQAAPVTASAPDSVTIGGDLLPQPDRWRGAKDSYYVGHWVQVVAGPGLGQTRRITGYRSDPGAHSTVFRISPSWDVPPAAGQARVIVARQFWQTYVVGNKITQSQPTCTKANPTGPNGGEITVWAPSADLVIEGNRQFDTNGIGFTQGYSVKTPSCPTCDNGSTVEMALEIRGNLLRGEYDWTSDCSWSGIHGTFGVSPTPEAPPPTLSFGVQVSYNTIEHADGLRGGAIDIVPTWHTGPEPHKWQVIDNLLLSHNVIRDIEGPPPLRNTCRIGQRNRVGIRIEGAGDVVGTVLYKNSCQRTGLALADGGTGTIRMCGTHGDDSCECEPRAR